MTMLTILPLVCAAVAMPPPPGAVSSQPTLTEQYDGVARLWNFDGTYQQPFEVALACFSSYVRGYGWRHERTVTLAQKGALRTDVAIAFTNRTERLAAVLSSEAPQRTSVRYRIDNQKKQTQKREKSL